MPSDSIAGFLKEARASQILIPEQVDELIRQPDLPQSDLTRMCEYLESRGVLTRFQSDMLRRRRGHELVYAGYPILEEIGPCAGGGIAYRAVHPSLRTPVELRRYPAELIDPADSPSALANRGQKAADLTHPHLLPVLEAGVIGTEAFAAIDVPPDTAALSTLVPDIGPMPGFLAAEFARDAVSALSAVHERELVHGSICPATALIGPLTSRTNSEGKLRRRPAPNAVLKIADLGLTSSRPAPASLAYLAPERANGSDPTPEGDLYGLGATLYFALTGRSPFPGEEPAELLQRIKTAEPVSLSILRPDLPPGFVAIIAKLMARDPASRPVADAELDAELAHFARPGTAPKHPTAAIPTLASTTGEPVEVDQTDGQDMEVVAEDNWGTDENTFTTERVERKPRPREPMTKSDKTRTRLLIALGAGLNLIALVGILQYTKVIDLFGSEPEPVKVTKPTREKPSKKPPKHDPEASP